MHDARAVPTPKPCATVDGPPLPRFTFLARELAVSPGQLGVLYRFEMEDELGRREVTAFLPGPTPSPHVEPAPGKASRAE